MDRYQNERALDELVQSEIEKLLEYNANNPDHWPFQQAVLQHYGSHVTNDEGLLPLIRLTADTRRSLSLRDAAFKSYVKNTRRLHGQAAISGETASLIDALFKESNSLAETALRAEHYLTERAETNDSRESVFIDRLESVIADTGRTENMRITALRILAKKNRVTGLSAMNIYEDSGIRLQTAILEVLVEITVTGTVKTWLEKIEPNTPEQEQLLVKILGQRS